MTPTQTRQFTAAELRMICQALTMRGQYMESLDAPSKAADYFKLANQISEACE